MSDRGLSAGEVSDVYRRYGGMLERRCRLILRDHAMAEDALQELCAMLLRRGEGLREAHSPYGWLIRCADRISLDLLRRTRRVREAVRLDDIDQVGAAPGVDAEARRVVLESIERLQDDERALAIMLFVDGLTQGEAASELGLSRVTINKRAQSIRSHLKLEIADHDPPSSTTPQEISP